MRKVKMHTSLLPRIVRNKLRFLILRLRTFYKTHKIWIPPEYENIDLGFKKDYEESEERIRKLQGLHEIDSPKTEIDVRVN